MCVFLGAGGLWDARVHFTTLRMHCKRIEQIEHTSEHCARTVLAQRVAARAQRRYTRHGLQAHGTFRILHEHARVARRHGPTTQRTRRDAVTELSVGVATQREVACMWPVTAFAVHAAVATGFPERHIVELRMDRAVAENVTGSVRALSQQFCVDLC